MSGTVLTRPAGFWARLLGLVPEPEAVPSPRAERRLAPAPAPPAAEAPAPAVLPQTPFSEAPAPAAGFVLPPPAATPAGAIERPDAGTGDATPAELARSAADAAEPAAAAPVPAAAIERPDAGAAAPGAEPAVPAPSWWQRLSSGLKRTSSQLGDGVTAVFTKRRLDEDTLEELEDVLLQADLGAETAGKVVAALGSGRYDKEMGAEGVRRVLAEEVAKVLAPVARPLAIDGARKPHVILVVGVNGTGKTTTIGKLASVFRAEGRTVVLAAGDTFRAAAIEQLRIWGERTGAVVVARDAGADAAGVAFDGLDTAKREGADVLVIDTAGRLQNKAGLMAELEKIVRVIRKGDPTAPHTVLLTLDATTGQNAVSQVETFGKVAGVTGLVMTKLDGTARGGILVAVAARFKLPVHFIGVGEGIDDLEPFDADQFARAIAGVD